MPLTNADWMPLIAALATFIVGLVIMIMPRQAQRLAGLEPAAGSGGQLRGSVGGFHAGAGFAALLFYDQPIVQIVLGLAWASATMGRLLSIVADSGVSARSATILLFNIALTVLFMGPFFGFAPAG
ncbi:hypothetical protein FPY71_14615 [Aureimonas fodinaquatilis]|uniref:DUF4345 domain-containing protein n=1 Tax=Aureimonas fodinaquatilis TaxID=2565783 RepID=A0A5B0DTH1_9HYPH|nr:hypothetical protein [Aureimonas fodinaquatilis]KAA0969746.1 hypothetical protein FPY71_14615 [Aureimonas fodinaquatilis]